MQPSDATIPTVVPSPAELRCSRCGYNLKGLDHSSNCPECGEAIRQTLTFGLLHADRVWLRRQARTMLLLIALPMLDYQTPNEWPYANYYVGVSVRVLLTAIATWGCWRLTRPDPLRPHTEREGMIARGLRVAAVVHALGLIVFFRSPAYSILSSQLWTLIFYAWAGALLFMAWLAMLLVLAVARRGGSPSLVTHARVIVWGLPLAKLSLVAFPMLALVMRYESVLGVLTVCSWAVSVVALLTATLLGRLHELLARASAAPTPTMSDTALPVASQ